MNERARSEAVAHSLENSAFFMPFSTNRQFKKAPRLFARAEGIHYYTPEGRQVIDGTSGLWCVNAGHCRAEDRRGGAEAGRDDGFRAAVPDGPPGGVRVRRPDRQARAQGHQPGVLHQLGLRVGRHRAQVRARLPPHARRGPPHAPDRARARLPRGQFRRHRGRRHRGQPQDLRRAGRGRGSHAPYPRPGEERLFARAAQARRRARRRPRTALPAARPFDHRRRDRRAGGMLDRGAGAAGRATWSACARSATGTASCSYSTK